MKNYNVSLDLGKIPPQAVEIEEAILGTFLLERDSWDFIGKVRPEMFYRSINSVVFEAIKQLKDDSKEIDILTVTEKLKKLGKLEESGGAVRLAEITKDISSARHLDYHLHIFIEKYLLREIIRQANDIMNDAFYGIEDIDDILRKVENLYKSTLNEIDSDLHIYGLNDLISESKDLATERMFNLEKGIKPGIPIPIGKLQDVIGGWQKSNLIYIAARPSMGKTAFAAHLAKHAAKKGFRTLFFSLEMSRIELTNRIILSETGIEPDRWRNGMLSESDFNLIEQAQGYVKQSFVY